MDGRTPTRRPAARIEAVAAVDLSVVVPVYRADDCLEELHRRLGAVLPKTADSYEIILVEDGGPDDSWSVIRKLAAADDRVRGLQLSRNFGQHHAIAAGLAVARGEWVVVMDCDLQDRPEAIPDLHAKAQEGYDCVLARRRRRRHDASKRITSLLYYRVFNFLTGLDHDGTVANFSIVSRRVVEQLNAMGEAVRFYPAFLAWMGLRKAYIEVEHGERFSGTSSYTLAKVVRMGFPIVLAYTNKPLKLCVVAGLIISGLSLLAGLAVIARALLYDAALVGWSSLIVSIYFSAGAIILVLGIVGLYVDRIFTEVKRRPLYIVRETTFDG